MTWNPRPAPEIVDRLHKISDHRSCPMHGAKQPSNFTPLDFAFWHSGLIWAITDPEITIKYIATTGNDWPFNLEEPLDVQIHRMIPETQNAIVMPFVIWFSEVYWGTAEDERQTIQVQSLPEDVRNARRS